MFALMTMQEATYYLLNKIRSIYSDGESSQITDWVMENLTGSKKAERMIYKNEAITDKEETQLKQYTERLLAHEPVQYVLNEAWFCGFAGFYRGGGQGNQHAPQLHAGAAWASDRRGVVAARGGGEAAHPVVAQQELQRDCGRACGRGGKTELGRSGAEVFPHRSAGHAIRPPPGHARARLAHDERRA